MIAVVDYGMGNLKSVQNAALVLGKRVVVTDSKATLKKAKKIIFPGVGHFGQAIYELKKRSLFAVLKGKIKEGVPFLGICVGMQVLFSQSQEAKGVKGLDVIKGEIKKFKAKDLIIPHMGWNQVRIRDCGLRNKRNLLFKGLADRSFFYFVHSYYCVPKDSRVVLSTTGYGVEFASSIHKDNIWAVQFHAEKSQKSGLKLFNNFLELC
ncbi:MAG: imidazole glycerol phosphate synthase subunit HisH [Omnitrophica bacterium]|nr:imidazole glycerol phosphate synthase subunit HisH [Candidatus Omnitrophota bacterium]